MTLKERIKEDIKKAMQQKDALKLSVLRMVSASVLNKEKEKRAKLIKAEPDITEEKVSQQSQLADQEVIEALMTEIKKRKDSIEQFEKGGRLDLSEQEKKELELLMIYAPKQADKNEIKKIVQEAIEKVGAAGPKDTGKVMGAVMPQLKGKADGTAVSKIVQDQLNK